MRNVKNLTLCVLMMALVSTAAVADIHYVNPGESIQAAIGAADPGDEIEVAPGTYTEAINFIGKAIRLYSSGGPDVTTIDGTGHYHVVQCVSGEDNGTILEGFTITGGNANGLTGFEENGGGMLNVSSSPTVTNCTFNGNNAKAGGGMYNEDYSSPTVTNCTFTGNTAYYGGGMHNDNASPTVTNCTFTGNTANDRGGGMHNWYNASPTVINCIFWSDSPNEIFDDNGLTTVTYSDVQGGTGETWFGEGCIDTDPMFADADGRLLAFSPCLDAGNDAAVPSGVTTDLDGNPRIQGVRVDMGAFEALATTPEMMLAGLKAYILPQVVLGNIDTELEGSLLAKVNAALAALDRGNPNDAKVAMNNLKALINQIEAQVGKKITIEAAGIIIQRANDIIAELGG